MLERSVLITELADSVPGAQIAGDVSGIRVTGLAYDSRKVTRGSLYVAVVGYKFDGHKYLLSARDSGASAFVVQSDHADLFSNLERPTIAVPSTRASLAPLACRFYDNPTSALYLAGVTGTNGKTSVTRMIDAIARAAGERTGVIGTLGTTIDGRDIPGDHTTPEAPDLQQYFAEMRSEGVQSAAIEVASHAIAMGRTDGCLFDVGVFTNLTQDHLDYHGDMETYRDVKAKLFVDYADFAQLNDKPFTAVVNLENQTGAYYGRITHAASVITYGLEDQTAADVRASEIERFIDRISYTVATPAGTTSINLPFGGGFNVENSLAAVGYGLARGISLETIAEGLSTCAPIPGRFQPVRAGQEFAVLIDYAHTPDGLENVLRSARSLTEGNVIAVFGCGGDRDRSKRPKMGRIAVDLADVAIVTSDNPRHENPESIIDEIIVGMLGSTTPTIRERDRRSAIANAIRIAQPGDTIVIAGKGHENYQIVGDDVLPFDDVVVAREELLRAA